METDRFAEAWIAAWNAHDLDAILAHYTDDIEFRSPLVTRLTGDPRGVLHGRPALRDYFAAGLERFPELTFNLRAVLGGAGSLTVEYDGVEGLVASETMELDGNLVKRALAHYRPAVRSPERLPNIHLPCFDEERGHPGYVARRARIGYQLATERLGVSLWELDPGQAAYPYHAHLAEEELVVVLSGTLRLRMPSGWRELREGEVIGFPQGPSGAHQIVNTAEVTARFLSLSTNGQADVVSYPEWGKVFAGERRPSGGGLRLFFHEEDAVGPWDGATDPPRLPAPGAGD